MGSNEIREAYATIRAFLNKCINVQIHGAMDALGALDALSTIDPEAIRREARAEALREAAEMAVAWQVDLCKRDDWHCECCTECNQLRYAILADEPAQDDGKPEEKREYILDRYHDGVLMAEGARVTASSLEEAIEKARHLPGYPRFTHDSFRERRIDEAKS